jgi:hypothetical protein
MPPKVVYENEEFNLLPHALNIEEGMDDLRYNNIIIAKTTQTMSIYGNASSRKYCMNG